MILVLISLVVGSGLILAGLHNEVDPPIWLGATIIAIGCIAAIALDCLDRLTIKLSIPYREHFEENKVCILCLCGPGSEISSRCICEGEHWYLPEDKVKPHA